MASLPRIITVDPTDSIPQQIRSAFSLMDRLVVQIDVPGPTEALEELKRGGIDFVISAWNPGNGIQGWELAAKLKQIDDNIQIMLMGDYDDTELDDEMMEQSPFVYLKRPFDIPQLINVLQAALDGGDIFAAVNTRPQATQTTKIDLGPVPNLNADKVDEIMQGVMFDLNPVAAMVATREGQIVVGRTTMGDVDYDYMASLIGSTASVNINMRDVIGGNLQTMQLFDGSNYDVYVLSVGLHHFLTIVFDGKDGAGKIGAVRRYGNRHAENLIAVMGPAAFLVQRAAPPEPKQETVRRISDRAKKYATQEAELPELEKASLGVENSTAKDDAPVEEEAAPLFDAIDDAEFDLDALFGEEMGSDADDLFSLDAMEELASQDSKKGTLGWDDAMQLGIIDDK